MFGKDFKIKSWKIVDGKRVVTMTGRRGARRKTRYPCVVCHKPSLHPYCSVRCVNNSNENHQAMAQNWPAPATRGSESERT
jgi:hypothetical protein